MKIIFIIVTIIILLVLGGLFIITGRARTDVILESFKLSDNGKTLTMYVAVSSSSGYIRDLKIKPGGDNKYITFYSTFGINSKLGAKHAFNIELNNSTTEIYFYKGNGGYKLVLQKNELNNQWEMVK